MPVEGIVLSVSMLLGSIIWSWMAVRKLRGKTIVAHAGALDTVCPPAFILATGWVLFGLVTQLFPDAIGLITESGGTPAEAPAKAGVLTLKTIQNSVFLSGGLAFILAVIYTIGNDQKASDQLPALRSVLLGVLAFVASIGPVLLIMMAIERFLGPNSSSHELLEFLKQNKSPEASMWVGASAVVAAPLLEELLYRVILQGWIRSRVHRDVAVIIVAVLFCFVHGWPNMLGLFPLAIALGVLYDRTNSYLAVVAAHATFNMVMLLLTALPQMS